MGKGRRNTHKETLCVGGGVGDGEGGGGTHIKKHCQAIIESTKILTYVSLSIT